MQDWSIVTTSTRIDHRARVLKQGDTFALFDVYGDIARGDDAGEQGLYHNGTRFLSRFELKLNGHRPLFLNSTLPHDNGMVAVDLSNPDLRHGSGRVLAKGTLHLFRALLLWDSTCHQHLRVSNHGTHDVEVWLALEFDSDYADIFEARGFTRSRRGEMLPAEVNQTEVTLAYQGLDGATRKTCFVFDPTPRELTRVGASYTLKLRPQEEAHFYLRIECANGDERPSNLDYLRALTAGRDALHSTREKGCHIVSSSERLNQWLERSFEDLAILMTKTDKGPYPYAGVPWFSCPFGRDGVITALEYLWVNPRIAQGVLEFLAAHQATEENAAQDAEPGKI
ncbi:MAG TPA: glycogen debranching N-terminal domain-containing protein, partial [Burkholderiales bacterium]|nr:glycogen debranching N-terminal domain-containing protein [Burkholderiales bacterium]